MIMFMMVLGFGVLLWMTCCLWILSGYYDYVHDGIMLWSITLDVMLPLDY